MPPNQLDKLVADPEFVKLSPSDQRRALAGVSGDDTFSKLNDNQTAQYVNGHIAALQPPPPPAAPLQMKPKGNPFAMIGEGEESTAQGQAQMGKQYVQAGPGEVVGGAKDIYQGNVARGGHRMIQGAGVTASPLAANLLPIAAATAPGATLFGAAGAYGGTKGAKYGAEKLGANEDQANLAGDVGGIAGGYLGSQVPSFLRSAVSKLPLQYEAEREIKLPWHLGKIVRTNVPEPTMDELAEAGAQKRIAGIAARQKAGLMPSENEVLDRIKPWNVDPKVAGRLPWQSGDFKLVLTPEEIADQAAQARLAGVVKEQLRPEAEVGGMYSAARGKVGKTPDYQGRIARKLLPKVNNR